LSRKACRRAVMRAGNGTVLRGTMKAGPVIDMTDSSYCRVSNMRIESQTADCGILLARIAGDNPHVWKEGQRKVSPSAGWHEFDNLWISGKYRVACVYNLTSEVNWWYGCRFMNTHPDGACFVMTYHNYAGLESPYLGKLCEQSSNVDQRIIGGLVCAWGCKYGILLRGHIGDFTLRDTSWGAHGGEAAIFLDAVGHAVIDIDIADNRFECGMKHVILMKGNVVRTRIQGNHFAHWGGGEAIRHEAAPQKCWPQADKVCSVNGNDDYLKERYAADRLVVKDNTFLSRDLKVPHTVWLDAVRNSEIEITSYERTFAEGTEQGALIGVGEFCEGTVFTVEDRADVHFAQTPVRTLIEAIREGAGHAGLGASVSGGAPKGIRRTYLGLKADTLLNLTPTDVTKIEHPKRGDIALDNGTNTQSGKPGLAVYDGESWVFMN